MNFQKKKQMEMLINFYFQMTQRLDIYGKLFTEVSKPYYEPQIVRNFEEKKSKSKQ